MDGHRHTPRGRAVQVDPIKLKLRPPGTKRLKPKCRTLLSTSAFKFKLRLYIEGGSGMPNADMVVVDSQAGPGPRTVCPYCTAQYAHSVKCLPRRRQPGRARRPAPRAHTVQ